MKNDDEEETVMDINDPQVPEAIRKHAARFKDPVRFVVFCGAEIILLSEEGELIDICTIS